MRQSFVACWALRALSHQKNKALSLEAQSSSFINPDNISAVITIGWKLNELNSAFCLCIVEFISRFSTWRRDNGPYRVPFWGFSLICAAHLGNNNCHLLIAPCRPGAREKGCEVSHGNSSLRLDSSNLRGGAGTPMWQIAALMRFARGFWFQLTIVPHSIIKCNSRVVAML